MASPIKHCIQEQINKLICYIVNDNLSLKDASKKADMSYATARVYYNKYVNDPNNNPPLVRQQFYSHISQPMSHIVENNAPIKPALEKANKTVSIGSKHDSSYRNSRVRFLHSTPEQIAQFIRYMVDEKMSMEDASKKANVPLTDCKLYYTQHLNNQ